MKKLYFGVLMMTLMFISTHLFSQVAVTFPSPAQPVTVCNGSSLLTARISVLAASPTGVDVTIDLADGMEYVLGSITKTGGTASLSIIENGGTPNVPLFRIPGPVAVGDNIIFTLNRGGVCSARTNSLAGMVFKDNVKGTIGAASANADSDAYTVRYPSFSFSQPATQTNALLYNPNNPVATTYTRTFTITNGQPACATAVYFTVEYPSAGIEQVSLTLAGNPVSPTSVSGNTYYYTINGAALGADNEFCNGESLTFTETYRIKTCAAVTNYTAGWGCDPAPANWCQTATGTGSVAMVSGVPNASAHSNTNIGYVNMCTPWVVRTTYTSGGTGNAAGATLYDVTLRKGYYYNAITPLGSLPAFYILGNTYVRDMGTGTNSVAIPSSLSGGIYSYNLDNFFAADPDGAGVGLEDVDGDGFFDDLPPGNIVTLDIDMSIDCAYAYSCNIEFAMPNLGGDVKYHTMCNRSSLVTSTALGASGAANSMIRNSVAANGYIPANIEGGTPFNVRGSIAYYRYESSLRTTNSRFVYEFTLPAGSTASNVKWANNAVFPSGTLVAHAGWTQVGNVLTITAPSSNYGWTTFDVVYDCSGSSNYQISYKVYDVNDLAASCSCLSEIACGNLTTLAYCPSPCPSGGPGTGVPVVRRADNSLGWTDYTMTTRQSAAAINAYDLSKALYLDEIEIHGNATQYTAQDNIYVELVLAKATGGISKLTPLNVDVEVVRGGSVISTATLTSFDQSTSTSTDQKVVWNLTAALPAGGLLANDEVRTVSRYQVATNSLPQHDIQSGGTWIFFNLDGSGNRLQCVPLVPEMYLVGLVQTDGHNAAAASGCGTTTLGGNFHFLALRFDAAGQNYLNEFRPGGYVSQYELTVPDAYELISCSYIPATGGSADPMTPDTVVGNTYTYNNPGTWEAYRTTFVNNYGAYIQPVFQPNCGARTNTEPVIGKVTVKDFYYHYADPSVTTWDKIYTHAPVPTYTNSPSATLADQTGLVQAAAPIESWVVKMNNPSLTTAPYTWLAIPDVPGVNIVQVIDMTTNTAVAMLPYTGGKLYQLDAAGLGSGISKDYRIQFSYTTCSLTQVKVLSGWNCGYFITDPNSETCGTQSQVTLSFNPQNAEVSIIPIDEPTAPVDLCQATPFEYRVNSSQAGNLINNTFSIYTVSGLTPTSGSFEAEYPAGAGNWASVPVTISGNKYTYDLTAHPAYPISGIPGINNGGSDPLNRQMGVRFTVTTDCDFAAGSNFQISAGGDRACGSPATGDDSKVQTAPININGVTLTYLVANNLVIDSGSAGAFNTCGTPITLAADHKIVELVGGATTGANGKIEVRLPLGYQYITGSFACTSTDCPTLATPAITTGSDGAEILNLIIPSGLSDLDVMSYTLQITENLSSPSACGDTFIQLITSDEATNVPCVTAPGGQCSSLKYQTGSFVMDVTVEKAALTATVNASNAVVSGSNESITVDFTLANSSTADAPAGVKVEAFYDVNNNGTFESAFDYLLGNHLISVDVPAGGSINESITFTSTPAQACDLLLVVRNSENPCICSGSFAVIPSPTILSGVAGNDRSICEVETTQLGLTNNAAYTYSWAGADAASLTSYLSSNTIAQPVFDYTGVALSATTTFTYDVTITRAGGCSSTDTVVITVYPTPVAPTASSPQAFCNSATVSQLVATVGAGQTIKWYDVATGGTALSASNALAHNFTYYAEAVGAAPGSCPSTTRTSVLVNIIAAPTAGTLDGNQNICVGSTTTFTASVAGGTWSSGTPTVATVDASGVVIGAQAGTSIISYTVSGGGTCPDATVTRTVTVTASPNAGNISGTTPMCAGTTATFTTSGNIGGTWSSVNPFVAAIDPTTGLVTANTAGTTTIKYTVIGTGGCSTAVANYTLTVNAPANAGTLSGNQDVCIGGSTTFTASIAGGTWSSSNNAIATVNASGVVSGLAAGSATISYTVAGVAPCADAIATRTVNVTTPPSAGTLSGAQTICVGNTTTFNSTVSGGTWSSSNVVVASVDSATGVITGNASGTATITYTVLGSGGCANATDTRTVTVSAPVSAGTISGNQYIAVGATTTLTSSVTGGTWSINPSSVATIDATSGVVTGEAAGTATVTYNVTGTGGCSSASTTYQVFVNAAPNAVNDNFTTSEDTVVNGNVGTNDNDSNINPNGFSLIAGNGPSNGTLVFNPNGTFTYTPNPNFTGTDSFQYTVCDMGMPVLCSTATATINVTPVNDAPVANNDTASTNEDTPVVIPVLTNDTDIEGIDPTTVTITDQPDHGTVSVNPVTGEITYTPDANYNGPDSFEYQVCDTGMPVLCDTAVVNITVNSVNDNPVAVDDTATTNEDTPVNISLLTNDSDVEALNPASVVATDPAHGTVTVNPLTGVATYTPDANFFGTDTFEYTVCDFGTPVLCDTALVTVTVVSVNDALIAEDDEDVTEYETPVTVDVLSNDYDVEGVNPSSVTIVNNPLNGTVVVNSDGTITYTPNPNFVGEDYFTYSVCDYGVPVLCDTALVTIIIEPSDLITNAFSPNGDGYNDTWEIPYLAQYPDFRMEIYDRWGNIVYEYNRNNSSSIAWWDGTSNGRLNYKEGEILPYGTYFYIIYPNQGTEQPKTGWVYLNR